MKTFEAMQEAVDAIKEVCKQHGVAIIGVCYSEGIHGEIEIADAAELIDSDITRLTNKVKSLNRNTIYVEGIGTPSNAKVTGSPALSASPCGLPGSSGFDKGD